MSLQFKQDQRRRFRAEEQQLIEETKARLSAETGLPRDAKFEKCWNLAWSYGHSSGFPEVEAYFREMCELIN